MTLAARARGLGLSAPFLLVCGLFLGWGLANALTDPLLMTLRAVFDLGYRQALGTQVVFFAAFGLVSLPAAALGERLGAARTALAGLAVMVAGCLLVAAALGAGRFWPVLAALFVLASGITTVQVAANPLAAAAGPARAGSFRLNLAQTFNSLGMIAGVHLGARTMLARAPAAPAPAPAPEAGAALLGAAGEAYLLLAAGLAALWLALALSRRRLPLPASPARPAAGSALRAALRSRWALAGAAAIALYVGAEVAIGSLMIGFLHQPRVAGLPLAEAGARLANVYWGGALAGRVLGIVLLARLDPARLLLAAAVAAAGLCLVAAGASGPVAGWAALLVGICNAIMFPVIFALTLARSAAPATATSGLLCFGIAAGAGLPLLAGWTADRAGLSAALAVPALAYIVIAGFARAAR